jgi:hypothetical protein
MDQESGGRGFESGLNLHLCTRQLDTQPASVRSRYDQVVLEFAQGFDGEIAVAKVKPTARSHIGNIFRKENRLVRLQSALHFHPAIFADQLDFEIYVDARIRRDRQVLPAEDSLQIVDVIANLEDRPSIKRKSRMAPGAVSSSASARDPEIRMLSPGHPLRT